MGRDGLVLVYCIQRFTKVNIFSGTVSRYLRDKRRKQKHRQLPYTYSRDNSVHTQRKVLLVKHFVNIAVMRFMPRNKTEKAAKASLVSTHRECYLPLMTASPSKISPEAMESRDAHRRGLAYRTAKSAFRGMTWLVMRPSLFQSNSRSGLEAFLIPFDLVRNPRQGGAPPRRRGVDTPASFSAILGSGLRRWPIAQSRGGLRHAALGARG
jgi:hypothetical protein